jgi:CheY-like chemotaxis protein
MERGYDMKRVLVIEDNVDNMELITFILEKNGYSTIKAENGKIGIELALEEKPDFIMLDIQLPDMNGLDVLQAIRGSDINGEVPVIAITSYAMSGDREKMLAAGCDGYIEKPIDPVTIINQIREIIGEER